MTTRAPARGALRRLLRIPTRLGWTVLACGCVAGLSGWWLGWRELQILAVACGIAVLTATWFVFGKADFSLAIDVVTRRSGDATGQLRNRIEVRGGTAEARIVVTANRRVSRGVEVDVPLARGSRAITAPVPYQLRALHRGGTDTFTVALPTDLRGVVRVGPVRTARADPMGLLVREMGWNEARELLVHPQFTPIGDTGVGLVRDLEGRETSQRSRNDFAFHSLRPYEIGDDMRHVDAISSARVGQLLVRQFVETRTARVAILVSGDPSDYHDEAEFELAVEVGASYGVRCIRDKQRVSMLAGGHAEKARSHQSKISVLDGFARAEFGTSTMDLATASKRLAERFPDTSLAIIVTGRVPGYAGLWATASNFGADARFIGIEVNSHGQLDVQPRGERVLMRVPSLPALRAAVRGLRRT